MVLIMCSDGYFYIEGRRRRIINLKMGQIISPEREPIFDNMQTRVSMLFCFKTQLRNNQKKKNNNNQQVPVF